MLDILEATRIAATVRERRLRDLSRQAVASVQRDYEERIGAFHAGEIAAELRRLASDAGIDLNADAAIGYARAALMGRARHA